MTKTPLLALLLLAAVPACRRDTPAPPAPAEAIAAPAARSIVAADAGAAAARPAVDETMGVKNLNDPAFGKLSLFGRLAVERENRPPSTLHAEAVFAAVADKLGIDLSDRRQLAGFPVQAGYTERANSAGGVNVVVAEYWDKAALAKGRELALRTKAERRELVTVGNTWVSITPLTDGAASAAEARRIAALVKTL